MPRDFTIQIDPSWLDEDGKPTCSFCPTVVRPFIQQTNTVPSLKNTGVPYLMYVGRKET